MSNTSKSEEKNDFPTSFHTPEIVNSSEECESRCSIIKKVEEYQLQGRKLFLEQKYEEAIDLYTRAIDFINSNSALCGSSLFSDCCSTHSNKQKDKHFFLDFLSFFHCNKSICLFKLNNFDSAINEANLSIKFKPDHAKSYYWKGLAYQKKNNNVECVENLRKSLSLDKNNKEIIKALNDIKETAFMQNDKIIFDDNPNNILEYIENLNFDSDIEKIEKKKKLKALIDLLMKKTAVNLDRLNFLQRIISIIVTEEELDMLNLLWKALELYIINNNKEIKITNNMFLDMSNVPSINEDVKACLIRNLSYDFHLEKIKQFFRKGVRGNIEGSRGTKQDEDNEFFRMKLVCRMLSLLKYYADISNETFLKVINACLMCVESESIQHFAIKALSVAVAYQKMKGKKVKALRQSHELNKCLESILSATSVEKFENLVGYSFIVIIELLNDKDRPESENVDMELLLESLLNSYFTNKDDSFSQWKIGLQGLVYFWHANRSITHAYITKMNLLPFFFTIASRQVSEEPKLRALSIDNIGRCMEFNDFRNSIIEAGGIEKLTNLIHEVEGEIKLKLGAVLAKMSIHNEETLHTLINNFEFIDFLKKVFIETAEANNSNTTKNENVTESLLQIILFLCMQEDFKKSLLLEENEVVLKKLIALGERVSECSQYSALPFLFCSVINTLVRSNEDKEKPNTKNLSLDLDDEQIEQLRLLYEKLPSEARPAQNGMTNLGQEDIVSSIRDIIINNNIAKCFSSVVFKKNISSKLTLGSIAATIKILCKNKEKRKFLIQQGSLKLLMYIADNLKECKNEQGYARQAIAQLCISIMPNLFTYRESLDVIPHLIELLKDPYELYQYEAALALTNLTSMNEEIRNRVWFCGGWRAFGELLFSENDLLRAAGLEGWCNMCCCEYVVNHFSQKKENKDVTIQDIKIMLAFTLEYSNIRAVTASTGALAMLAEDARICQIIVEQSNSNNLLTALRTTDDSKILLRILSCIEGIVNSQNIPESYLKEVQKEVERKKDTLKDSCLIVAQRILQKIN